VPAFIFFAVLILDLLLPFPFSQLEFKVSTFFRSVYLGRFQIQFTQINKTAYVTGKWSLDCDTVTLGWWKSLCFACVQDSLGLCSSQGTGFCVAVISEDKREMELRSILEPLSYWSSF